MIKYRMTANKMLALLKKEKVETWFDLGLFIDRFKEQKPVPTNPFKGTYDEFKEIVGSGGIAFITFFYSIDGVTIEVEKYAKIFRKNLINVPIHYIAGQFFPEADELIDPRSKKYQIDEMAAFGDWDLYEDFFHKKLERGSKEYNELITKFWAQTLTIVEKLAKYIEKNKIKLLYIINANSNPGNVSLSLANVLVSEYLGIPVINNNHDYYWEGGSRPIDIAMKNAKAGPRDQFFTNSDIGEFFSQIEVLFPWESRSWINVNINKAQSEHIILENGHNPANVTEIGTAVDTNVYSNIGKREKINTYHQFEQVLSRYEKQLISYSEKDVLGNKLIDICNPRPILIGEKTTAVSNFLAENIIFLQPTRIIQRKRIELGFKVLEGLFKNKIFIDKFATTSNLKLTLLVTGPVALGHYDYLEALLGRFSKFIKEIAPQFRNRVYLAFLFSELDRDDFKKKFKKPVGIPELYNIASLILLPSKTEGRGLPIIEATACGTPIFCRRYFPENVYSEVIGEHLPEKDRLKVIEFRKNKISDRHIKQIVDRVLFPHKFAEEITHNLNVVHKRYSLESLNKNLGDICERLYYQMSSNEASIQHVKGAFEDYKTLYNYDSEDFKQLVPINSRHYSPGYGKLAFMIYLKSLIDPSFFRVEKQNFKGLLLSFAKEIIDNYEGKIKPAVLHEFYNAVDSIFYYQECELNIRHDHSFSYRMRNKNYYPYQDYTIQELTGLLYLLYFKIIDPDPKKPLVEYAHFFTDWNLAISQLTSRAELGIDDRSFLIDKMKKNLPIAIFPGDYLNYEIEFFALQSIRSRLKLKFDEELTEEIIKKNAKKLQPVHLFTQERSFGRLWSKRKVVSYLEKSNENELKLLYKYRILRILNTTQKCYGIHFGQLGKDALKALRFVQKKKGYIVTNRRFAAAMTDIVDIDRFHIGNVTLPVTANLMGIPIGSGFIQFVPAGVRATLAYPTPIQTAKDFSNVLKSDLFKDLCKNHGQEKVLDVIRKDAKTNGSPVIHVLNNFKKAKGIKKDVDFKYVSGVYNDGLPWNGVIATANVSHGKNWEFVTVSSKNNTQTVTKFVEDFEKSKKVKAKIAWNGGYILNPELVGKLGLPEVYIGSPLGLLISNKKLTCPPLFNKATLLIYENGKIDIKKVNSSQGLIVTAENDKVEFSVSNYNNKKPDSEPCYYDLLYDLEEIPGDGRIIVRLAGNVIKELIKTKKGENVKVIPVGITLSFDPKNFPVGFSKPETSLNIKVVGIDNVLHAVEAGPLLVEEGKFCLDMKDEGWKTTNSIRTQAARLDYLDMRGPKIAVGIDRKGNLAVLTINGRIRESVGATHIDMADILMSFDMVKAMGFDPGGSSTLVVEGETLNISPYNKKYETNIYSLPPEPRAVSNAVIGFIK